MFQSRTNFSDSFNHRSPKTVNHASWAFSIPVDTTGTIVSGRRVSKYWPIFGSHQFRVEHPTRQREIHREIFAMQFDPDTGRAPDGTIGPTEREHLLATESLKLQELIADAETQKAKAVTAGNAAEVNKLAETVRASYRKLSEIQRQQREERQRKNRALGYE
jgi:hypothetical protein